MREKNTVFELMKTVESDSNSLLYVNSISIKVGTGWPLGQILKRKMEFRDHWFEIIKPQIGEQRDLTDVDTAW